MSDFSFQPPAPGAMSARENFLLQTFYSKETGPGLSGLPGSDLDLRTQALGAFAAEGQTLRQHCEFLRYETDRCCLLDILTALPQPEAALPETAAAVLEVCSSKYRSVAEIAAAWLDKYLLKNPSYPLDAEQINAHLFSCRDTENLLLYCKVIARTSDARPYLPGLLSALRFAVSDSDQFENSGLPGNSWDYQRTELVDKVVGIIASIKDPSSLESILPALLLACASSDTRLKQLKFSFAYYKLSSDQRKVLEPLLSMQHDQTDKKFYEALPHPRIFNPITHRGADGCLKPVPLATLLMLAFPKLNSSLEPLADEHASQAARNKLREILRPEDLQKYALSFMYTASEHRIFRSDALPEGEHPESLVQALEFCTRIPHAPHAIRDLFAGMAQFANSEQARLTARRGLFSCSDAADRKRMFLQTLTEVQKQSEAGASLYYTAVTLGDMICGMQKQELDFAVHVLKATFFDNREVPGLGLFAILNQLARHSLYHPAFTVLAAEIFSEQGTSPGLARMALGYLSAVFSQIPLLERPKLRKEIYQAAKFRQDLIPPARIFLMKTSGLMETADKIRSFRAEQESADLQQLEDLLREFCDAARYAPPVGPIRSVTLNLHDHLAHLGSTSGSKVIEQSVARLAHTTVGELVNELRFLQ